jgi:hypothetical protein
LDDREFFHFGASIKDAGKRGFMFSLIEEPEIIKALQKMYQHALSRRDCARRSAGCSRKAIESKPVDQTPEPAKLSLPEPAKLSLEDQRLQAEIRKLDAEARKAELEANELEIPVTKRPAYISARYQGIAVVIAVASTILSLGAGVAIIEAKNAAQEQKLEAKNAELMKNQAVAAGAAAQAEASRAREEDQRAKQEASQAKAERLGAQAAREALSKENERLSDELETSFREGLDEVIASIDSQIEARPPALVKFATSTGLFRNVVITEYRKAAFHPTTTPPRVRVHLLAILSEMDPQRQEEYRLEAVTDALQSGLRDRSLMGTAMVLLPAFPMSSEALATRTCAAWLAFDHQDGGETLMRNTADDVAQVQLATISASGLFYSRNRYPVRPVDPVCKNALVRAIALKPELAMQVWLIRELKSSPSKSLADLLHYFDGKAPLLKAGLTLEEWRQSVPPALASSLPDERKRWLAENRELVDALVTPDLPAVQQGDDKVLLRLITNQWVPAADFRH